MALTAKLIEAVKRHSLLYDIANPDYKNIKKRDVIWQEIGASLGEEGEELKKKWRNLRDTYAKYLRSIMADAPGAKRSYRNWQWCELMGFFRPYLKFNIKAEINNDIESDPEVKSSASAVCEENSIGDSIIEEEIPLQPISVRKPSTSSGKKRKKKEEKSNDPVSEAFLNYLQNKRSIYQGMSANELLLLGYAKTLDSFSLRRQAIVKMKIAKLFEEAEMQHIDEMEGDMADPLESEDVFNVAIKEEAISIQEHDINTKD